MASPSVALAQGEAFVVSGLMSESYDLPHLSFRDQANKLVDRGLQVHDIGAAEDWLERIGYYRLRPYWTALRNNEGKFRNGASLASAVDLYVFDSRLRQCLMFALERVEVMLRVQVSHAVGRRDVVGHRQIACLDNMQHRYHQEWLARADDQLNECREQWLTDFQQQFSGPVPTWMAVEAWSFGVVSRLYQIMNRNDRSALAKRYHTNHETFASWMRACATVRNQCAHHNRIWNKPLIDQPAVPKTWEAKPVQHIAASRRSETRIYALLAILAYLQDNMGHSSRWKSTVKDLACQFPAPCGLSLLDAGFPDAWETFPLWG